MGDQDNPERVRDVSGWTFAARAAQRRNDPQNEEFWRMDIGEIASADERIRQREAEAKAKSPAEGWNVTACGPMAKAQPKTPPQGLATSSGGGNPAVVVAKSKPRFRGSAAE
eukprot:3783602-Karenia_brevis.AAC.1